MIDVEQGKVVSVVSPSEGAEVDEGSTVTIVVVLGNSRQLFRPLKEKSQSEAESALAAAAGLREVPVKNIVIL